MTRDFNDRDDRSPNSRNERDDAREELHDDAHPDGTDDTDRHDEDRDYEGEAEAEHEEGGEGGGGEGEPGGRGGRGGRGRGRGRGRGGDDRERRPRLDNFEKMKVWQEAHQLVLKTFEITPKLPQEQQAGIAMQMEQTAVAVPKSIAEGFKRRGPRNKAHFYNVAQSSLEALRYYFILCRDLKFDFDAEDMIHRSEQISRMLDGLVRSMMRA